MNSLTHTHTHKLFFFGFRVKTLETAGCPAAADGDFLLVNQRREPSSSSSSLLGHINTDRVSRRGASGPLFFFCGAHGFVVGSRKLMMMRLRNTEEPAAFFLTGEVGSASPPDKHPEEHAQSRQAVRTRAGGAAAADSKRCSLPPPGSAAGSGSDLGQAPPTGPAGPPPPPHSWQRIPPHRHRNEPDGKERKKMTSARSYKERSKVIRSLKPPGTNQLSNDSTVSRPTSSHLYWG